MAEEIDESDFYRADFSTESDWEVFNAQLCESLQKWELSNTDWGRPFEEGELFRCDWDIQTECITLLKSEIMVSYYVAQLKPSRLAPTKHAKELSPPNDDQLPLHFDLMSLSNTFGPPVNSDGRTTTNDLHILARLYGLRRFVLLHPRHHKQTQFFTNPSEFSFFLSAANVAAAEIGSAVPIFVQVYDPNWNYFLGVGIAPSLRTNFDLVALEQSPNDCRYLSGLLAMFKEKLPASCNGPATVSVRTTYAQETVRVRVPMQVPFTKEPAMEANEPGGGQLVTLGCTQFIALPSGYFPDSCTEMYSVYTWPELSENMAIDSQLRSDFVPAKAPLSSVHQVVRATSYLTSCLRDFHKLQSANESLEYYVGRNFSDAQRKLHGPMNDNELNVMLGYLFPGNNPLMEELFPYAKQANKQEFDPHRVKSAVPDSLVSRLSCILANCHAHCGSKNGLAQLWAGFTKELRTFWDTFRLVPGVSSGYPDTRTCLLHQKLQMLNVCVERHNRSEFSAGARQVQPTAAGKAKNTSQAVGVADDSEREREKHEAAEQGEEEEDGEDDELVFYDCTTEEGATNTTTTTEEPKSDGDEQDEDDDITSGKKPEGRDCRLSNLMLLDCPNEPLYVPVTQEVVPKTEDQLHDDEEAMLKLGPGSGLTTEMMCSSLLSDMEAFKAANPRCCMEDFIRWYSPKDWEPSQPIPKEAKVVPEEAEQEVEEEKQELDEEKQELDEENQEVEEEKPSAPQTTDRGRLSARMTAPDNTWQRVWQQAKPKPIWRQKRLFDETHEAIKVLQYLETRKIGEIYELILVPLLHAAVVKLKDIFNHAQLLDIFAEQFDATLAELCRLSREVEIIERSSEETSSGGGGTCTTQMPNPEQVIRRLEELERQFYQFKCYQAICSPTMPIEEVKQAFADIRQNGGSSRRMPAGRNSNMAKLISKDYVIRWIDADHAAGTGPGNTNNPSAAGKAGPQFLRAIVSGEKVRLCGAFTENTTFV